MQVGHNMASIVIAFIIGLWIGGMVGFFAFALVSVGHFAEERMKLYARKVKAAEFHFVDE